MKFNRKIEYALIALKHMHNKRPGEVTPVKEIADSYGCSTDVMAKVLQRLCKSKILLSNQGTQGGYMIQKDLTKFSLYDLINLILGPMSVVRCLHDSSPNCEIKNNCNILKPIAVLNGRLEQFYQSLSVQEIISEASLR